VQGPTHDRARSAERRLIVITDECATDGWRPHPLSCPPEGSERLDRFIAPGGAASAGRDAAAPGAAVPPQEAPSVKEPAKPTGAGDPALPSVCRDPEGRFRSFTVIKGSHHNHRQALLDMAAPCSQLAVPQSLVLLAPPELPVPLSCQRGWHPPPTRSPPPTAPKYPVSPFFPLPLPPGGGPLSSACCSTACCCMVA
jgi:hypothetical protein